MLPYQPRLSLIPRARAASAASRPLYLTAARAIIMEPTIMCRDCPFHGALPAEKNAHRRYGMTSRPSLSASNNRTHARISTHANAARARFPRLGAIAHFLRGQRRPSRGIADKRLFRKMKKPLLFLWRVLNLACTTSMRYSLSSIRENYGSFNEIENLFDRRILYCVIPRARKGLFLPECEQALAEGEDFRLP